MANGDTKTEAMLNVLGNGGNGDEFRGCCNTKTQSYILDAIDRINALQPGGSSDFNDLENRPQLNGTAMTGNTNITDFVGTDGTNAGAQGLVPAPTTADADKFLKSDGTWATAGGGGGPTVVQTTGTSTTDVMSQNAVCGLIYSNPASQEYVKIGKSTTVGPAAIAVGDYASARGTQSLAIGRSASTGNGANNVAIGFNTNCGSYQGCVALGVGAGVNGRTATENGLVLIDTSNSTWGFRNTLNRVIRGVHDGIETNDAVTVGQISQLLSEINSALGTSLTITNGVITNGGGGSNSSDASNTGNEGGEPGPEVDPSDPSDPSEEPVAPDEPAPEGGEAAPEG